MSATRALKRALIAPCLGALALQAGLTPTAAQAGYVDEITGQTPLLYWRFNEQPGATSLTPEVNNLDALLGAGNFAHTAFLGGDIVVGETSGPALTPSGGFLGLEPGNSWFNFNLSGAGSSVDNITNPKNSVGLGGGSVSMWTRATDPNAASANVSGVLYRGDEGGGNLLNVRMIDDAGESPTIIAQTDGAVDYSDGQWHHVAATWDYDADLDAGTIRIYVNGGPLAGGELVSAVFDSASYPAVLQGEEILDFDFRHRIGKGRDNARRFNGDIDEPAIWNRALTDQEIAAQFNAALVPEPASVLLLGGAAAASVLRRRRA